VTFFEACRRRPEQPQPPSTGANSPNRPPLSPAALVPRRPSLPATFYFLEAEKENKASSSMNDLSSSDGLADDSVFFFNDTRQPVQV